MHGSEVWTVVDRDRIVDRRADPRSTVQLIAPDSIRIHRNRKQRPLIVVELQIVRLGVSPVVSIRRVPLDLRPDIQITVATEVVVGWSRESNPLNPAVIPRIRPQFGESAQRVIGLGIQLNEETVSESGRVLA